MKKILPFLLTFIALMLNPLFCQAHNIYDKNKETKRITQNTLYKLDDYMQSNYNIKLTENITIINTCDYKKDIKKYNLEDYEYAIEHSAAFSIPEKNIIVINMNTVTKDAYQFFLVHELVHKYQALQAFKEKSSMNNHVGIVEGIADKIAEKITGIELSSNNQNIPYNNLKTNQNFKNSIIFFGDVKVYEQCRFYAEEFMKSNPDKLYVK